MKSASKHIVYQPVLVTYLDVLGFRDRIKKTERRPLEVKRTYALLRRLQDQYSSARRFIYDANHKPEYITHFRSFSDLMLRITRVIDGQDSLAGYLNGELTMISNIQCDCVALSGDLLRGAIYHGNLYFDDDVTFGPALGQAHQLESSTAVFPRIMVDVGLMERAKRIDRVWEHGYIQRGDDGVYFVDYLFGSYMDRMRWPEEVKNTHDQILDAHRDVVVKKLKGVEKEMDYRKRQKVIWLAQYHNNTARKLAAHCSNTPRKHFAAMEVPEHLFQY